jgi:hypothetical protein
MRIRKAVLVLLACISFSFSAFASEYDGLIEDYGIESWDELEEALQIYVTVKDDYYGIYDLDDLENALYTYEYFDEAISEEGRPRLSDSQRWALDDLNDKTSEEIEIAHSEGMRDCLKGIIISVVLVFILGATVGKDYAEKHYL